MTILGTILIIALIMFLIGSVIGPVADQTVGKTAPLPSLIAIDSNTAADSGLTMGFNGAYPASLSEGGICFLVPNSYNGRPLDSYNLRQVKFNMVVTLGAPSGTFQALLFASTGTIGNNCTPTGAALTSSATQVISAINGYTPFFTFAFPYFPLAAGVVYAISLRIISCTTCNATNYWSLEYINTNLSIHDNIYYWNNPYAVGGPNSKLQYEIDGDPISLASINFPASPGLIPSLSLFPLFLGFLGLVLIARKTETETI